MWITSKYLLWINFVRWPCVLKASYTGRGDTTPERKRLETIRRQTVGAAMTAWCAAMTDRNESNRIILMTDLLTKTPRMLNVRVHVCVQKNNGRSVVKCRRRRKSSTLTRNSTTATSRLNETMERFASLARAPQHRTQPVDRPAGPRIVYYVRTHPRLSLLRQFMHQPRLGVYRRVVTTIS